MKESILMESYSSEKKSLKSNKLITFSITFSSLLFLLVIFLEKTKIFMKLVPTMRGEISLSSGYVITSIKNKYPFIVRSEDPFVGDELRFTGNIKSLFARTANNLCQKKDVVIEIGAHFGYNAINIGSYLRGNGKYYAIEPNPKVASCLRKNIILNDLDNTVKIHNKAISDHVGTCVIEDAVSYHKDEQDKYEKPLNIRVECSTLDKEFPNIIPSLVLIDVPGSEFQIIDGTKEILTKSPNVKMLVNIDCESSETQTNVSEKLSTLTQEGYNFFEVTSANEFNKITAADILAKRKILVIITKDEI